MSDCRPHDWGLGPIAKITLGVTAGGVHDEALRGDRTNRKDDLVADSPIAARPSAARSVTRGHNLGDRRSPRRAQHAASPVERVVELLWLDVLGMKAR